LQVRTATFNDSGREKSSSIRKFRARNILMPEAFAVSEENNFSYIDIEE